MKEMFTQIAKLWNSLPAGQKLVGVVLGIVTVGAAVALIAMGNATEWRVAATGVERADAQKLLAKLEESGIPFKLSDEGRTVLVPSDRLPDVQSLVVRNDLMAPDAGKGWAGLRDANVIMPESQLKLRMRVAQEEQLALSLKRFEGVEDAVVHITPAIRSWNRQDSRPAKASVMVQAKPGRMLLAGEVESVIQLVAHAVEGLEPDNVVVSDYRGMLLSRASGADRGLATRAVRAQEEEMHLQEKAESALALVLGPNKAVVRVDAELDLRKVEEVRHVVDPETRVVVSETQRTQSSTKSGAAAKGQPSTVAVQSGAAQAGAGQDSSTEDMNSSYDYGRSEIRTTHESGSIQRLTVGMVLDESLKDRGEALMGVVKGAVGFDAKRGDTLEVAYVPFLVVEAPTPSEAPPAEEGLPVTDWIRYGITAAVSLVLIGWMILSAKRARKTLAQALAPAVAPVSGASATADGRPLAEGRPDPRGEFRRMVDEDVDTVARVMRNWLYEPARKS
jgi:flagellar M-ring protein FliF